MCHIPCLPGPLPFQDHKTKQRSSGPNIYDAEKIVLTTTKNGNIKKTVLKETITIDTRRIVTRRKKNYSGTERELSGEAQRKRAKTADNILNHINENSKENKAKMISKVIGDEGKDFGNKVKLSSKVLKENESLTVSETSRAVF